MNISILFTSLVYITNGFFFGFFFWLSISETPTFMLLIISNLYLAIIIIHLSWNIPENDNLKIKIKIKKKQFLRANLF